MTSSPTPSHHSHQGSVTPGSPIGHHHSAAHTSVSLDKGHAFSEDTFHIDHRTSIPVPEPPPPPKWYQQISVHGVLGGAVNLLKRLTAFPMVSSAAITFFDEDDRFDPTGSKEKTEPPNDNDPDMGLPSEKVEVAVNYEKATQALFESMIRYRKEAQQAKDTYHTAKVDLSQFPGWNDNHIDQLRSSYQVFDINGDGLTDFEEFTTILEEFGDPTSTETKKMYFDTADDGSGNIDFMQFIKLVYRLTVKTPNEPGGQQLAETFHSIDRNMGRIRSLDVVQQLQAGLF